MALRVTSKRLTEYVEYGIRVVDYITTRISVVDYIRYRNVSVYLRTRHVADFGLHAVMYVCAFVAPGIHNFFFFCLSLLLVFFC